MICIDELNALTSFVVFAYPYFIFIWSTWLTDVSSSVFLFPELIFSSVLGFNFPACAELTWSHDSFKKKKKFRTQFYKATVDYKFMNIKCTLLTSKGMESLADFLFA